MGAESSSFTDCKFEGEVSLSSRECWTLNQATAKDGSKVSVFVYPEPQKHSRYIENAAKYLKILRHPGIVKFLALHREPEETWLITERVEPLETALETLTAPEICAGLYTIADSLAFLHDKVGVCHNNLSLSSIFIASDGSWQLGGLDFMCKHLEATPSYLSQCKHLRNEAILAPEEKAGNPDKSPDLGHARDAYAFGMISEGLLEYLTELGDLTKTFELIIQDEFLSSDPQDRPKLSTILVDRLFRNDYLEIVNFLKLITIKSPEEKKTFFWGIAQKLHKLPVNVVGTRLVRPLLSRFVLLDSTACECLVPHLLAPYRGTERAGLYKPGCVNPLLPEPLFKRHVIPELYKIFHVRDAHIRRVILRYFSYFGDLFDRDLMKKSILPQILLGLRDTDDQLVGLTLHAVADLVPLLGGSVVIGANRTKIFSQNTPKFGPHNSVPEKGNRRVTNDVISVQNGIPPKPRTEEKRTLKDMARESERLKNKEEARKRQEERKKKREERKNKPIAAKIVSNDSPEREMSRSKMEDADDDGLTRPEVDNSEWNDWDAPNTGNNSNPETSSSPRTGRDFSGGGASNGVRDTPDLDQTESDIDREIEDELDAMESGEPEVTSDRPDSPMEPVEVGPPVNVDWSDVSTSAPGVSSAVTKEARKGALKLKTAKQKTRTSPPPSDSHKPASPRHYSPRGESKSRQVTPRGADTWGAESGGGWEDGWGGAGDNTTPSPSPTHSPANTSPRVSTSPGKSTGKPGKKQRPRVVDLDIDSLDIKTSGNAAGVKPPDPELDLFADMAPVITTQTDLLSLLAGGGALPDTSSRESSTGGLAGMSFAVQDTPDNNADGGWGDDDLDWGEPDES